LPLYSPDVAAVAVGAALDFAFAVRNISAQAKDILSPARSHLLPSCHLQTGAYSQLKVS